MYTAPDAVHTHTHKVTGSVTNTQHMHTSVQCDTLCDMCLMSSVLYIRACVCCRQCCTYMPVSVVDSAVHTCLCRQQIHMRTRNTHCHRLIYLPPATDSHWYTQDTHTLSQTNILSTGDRFALVHATHTHTLSQTNPLTTGDRLALVHTTHTLSQHSYTQHTLSQTQCCTCLCLMLSSLLYTHVCLCL